MHVPITYSHTLQDLLSRAPLPGRSTLLSGALSLDSPATKNPQPVAGVRLVGGGGSPYPAGSTATATANPVQGSWDPKIFSPDRPVSRYCGLQFSGVKEPISVSPKPGMGFKKPECGQWVRTLGSGSERKVILHNCDVLSCPTCMPGAITQKAQDVQARFDLYEQAKTAENAALIPGERKDVKPRHFPFTVSPAKRDELIAKTVRMAGKWDPEIFLDLIRAEFSQALKLSGLFGGFIVYHDGRVRHPDTGLTGSRAKHLISLEAKSAGNMKDNDAAWMIYDHIRKQKQADRYYYFSPHFHVIAFGKAIDIAEFERAMPGWSYHNKGPVPNPAGLARYLFSHMAMMPNRHSCSWFGRMSSAVLAKDELKTSEVPVICEKTGQPWIILESSILDEVGREYTEKITEYRGFFRPKRRRNLIPDIGNAWKKLHWPGRGKRPGAPDFVKERGLRAMMKFMDDNEMPDGIGHL